MLNIS